MRLLFLGILLLAVGCQSFSNDRVQGTVDAGNAFFATESAQIALSSIQYGTQTVATIQAKESELAEVQNVNQQMAQSVALSSSPTPALIVGAAAASDGMSVMDSMPEDLSNLQGESSFVVTGISQTVRESDDCVVNPETSFQTGNIEQLYLTFIGTSVSANTPLTAEWYVEGQLVTADNWIVPTSFSEACFWFVIDRSDTSFPAGGWSARLLYGGNVVSSALEFTITG